MNSLVRLSVLAALTALLISPAAAQLAPLWEYSVAASNKPAWLGQGLQRGIAYGTVDGQDLLFVAGREAGGTVRVLDPATGAVIDTLSNAGISGGTFVLNDIGVSDDGVIFACNMTTGAQVSPFKVYRWNGLDADPQVVIEFRATMSGMRLGDKCTISGSASDNSLILYAAAPGELRIVRFTTRDEGRTFAADLIESPWWWVGSTPTVAPVGPGPVSFYLNAINESILHLDADGSDLAQIPASALGGSYQNHAMRYITVGTRPYLAVYDYGIPGARIVELADDVWQSRRAGETPSLSTPGGPTPLFGQGGIAHRLLSDGSFEIFVLATDVGIAAYRSVPRLAADRETFSFGDVFVEGSRSLTVRIGNTGLETLVVSAVDLDAPDAFSLSGPEPVALQPGDEATLTITFTPDAAGEYAGTLRLSSNDPERPLLEIPITATALLPPVIVVDAETLEADLHTGQTASRTVRISNNGFSDLSLTIRSRSLRSTSSVAAESDQPDGLAAPILRTLFGKQAAGTRSGEQAGDLALLAEAILRPLRQESQLGEPSPTAAFRDVDLSASSSSGDYLFAFDGWARRVYRLDLITGHTLGSFLIPDGQGVDNMAYDGIHLYMLQWEAGQTVLRQRDPYTGTTLDLMVLDMSWATGIAYTGSHLYVLDTDGRRLCKVDFEAKTLVDCVSLSSDFIRLSYLSSRGTLLSHSWDHSGPREIDPETGVIVGVVNLPGGYSDFSYSSALDLLFLTNPWQEIFAVDLETGQVVHSYPASAWLLAVEESGASWLKPQPRAGSVPAGEFLDVDLVFDASGMFGGRYEAEVRIVSNDPATPSVSLVATLDVTGAAIVYVAQESLDFGTVYVAYPKTLELEIENRGTETLEISSIVADLTEFSVGAVLPLAIPPRRRSSVSLSFAPADSTAYEGWLTLESSDEANPQVTLPLRGTGLFPPLVYLAGSSLVFEAGGEDDDSRLLMIRNDGLSDLSFSISTTGGSLEEHAPGTAGAYNWHDSDDPNGPQFHWLSAFGGTNLQLADDELRWNVPLGFSFDFYGSSVTHVAVSSNGWISVGQPSSSFLYDVPTEWDDNAHGAIAAFSHDLNPAAGGNVRYRTYGDAPDRYFVLEFINVPFYGWSGLNTFATVIYERTNTIRFQYLAAAATPYAFGIQSANGSWGIGSSGVGEAHIDPSRIRHGYAIEFRTTPRWLAVDPGAGSVVAGDSVHVTITASGAGLPSGQYHGQLTVMTNDPSQGPISMPVSFLRQPGVSTEGQPPPTAVALQSGYPNPFNPSTTILFDLPHGSHALLRVYDLLGRSVATLIDDEMPAGRHEVRWEADGLAAGTYIIRLEVGDFVQTRRMVLMK